MDWTTFLASLGTALLSGGIVGGLVSLIVSKRESHDRQDALALERQKWQHERDAPLREKQRQAVLDGLEAAKVLADHAQRRRNMPTESWPDADFWADDLAAISRAEKAAALLQYVHLPEHSKKLYDYTYLVDEYTSHPNENPYTKVLLCFFGVRDDFEEAAASII